MEVLRQNIQNGMVIVEVGYRERSGLRKLVAVKEDV